MAAAERRIREIVMNNRYSQTQLEAFLDEALTSSEMSAIEESLRDDEGLQELLAAVIGRRDAGIHSLGAIWRRQRLTCPSREELGSFLLGVVDAPRSEYIQFHLETMQCRYCVANVEDLQAERPDQADVAQSRRQKYFQSSAGMLAADDDGS